MRQAVLANTAALIGGLLVLSPAFAPVAAQDAASKCEVNQDKPKELALAYLTFTRISSQPAGPAKDPAIKGLLKDLMDKPEKFVSNPGGYNYILASVLSMAAQQPDGLSAKTRGDMGLTTRPTEAFDVVQELNDAITKWEAAAPSCAPDAVYLRNSEAWMAVTNKAFSFVEKGPADSAIYFAQRSIKLSPTNPFAHHILASVAATKNDTPTAMAEWKEVIKLAAADTNFRDIKQNALFYLGTSELQAAAKATGDAQKTQAKAAGEYFKQFLENNPTSSDAPNVMNNWASALQMSDDVNGIKAIYADMIVNPGKYSESTLATAGVIASVNAKDDESAVKLFEGIVAANPYSRDGLRNLASTLFGVKRFAEVPDVARKLVAIDPNNFDGIMYQAYAANELEKLAKTPAEKKAMADTLVKYSALAEKLNARVDVSAFTRSADGADVTLQVEQAGATAGTYTVEMEFLDKTGAVVATATESVGPIAKGEKKAVTLKAKGAGIVGFRYKPLN